MSRILILLGILLVLIGLCWPLMQKLGLGHMPGDIIIKRKNLTFYFPIATSILISLIVSLIFWLISKL